MEIEFLGNCQSTKDQRLLDPTFGTHELVREPPGRTNLSDLPTRSKRDIEAEQEKYTCPICLDILKRPVALNCSHTFCHKCLQKAAKSSRCCPICRTTQALDPEKNTEKPVLGAYLKHQFDENNMCHGSGQEPSLFDSFLTPEERQKALDYRLQYQYWRRQHYHGSHGEFVSAVAFDTKKENPPHLISPEAKPLSPCAEMLQSPVKKACNHSATSHSCPPSLLDQEIEELFLAETMASAFDYSLDDASSLQLSTFSYADAHFNYLNDSGDRKLQENNSMDRNGQLKSNFDLENIMDDIDITDILDHSNTTHSNESMSCLSLLQQPWPKAEMHHYMMFNSSTVSPTAALAQKLPTASAGKTKVAKSSSAKRTRSSKPKRAEVQTKCPPSMNNVIPVPPVAWRELSVNGSPPSARYDCGTCVYGNRMFVMGGICGQNRLNDLYMLDFKEKTLCWRKITTTGCLPLTGVLHKVFVIGSTMYAIGGTIDGQFMTDLHGIDLDNSTWEWKKIPFEGTPPSMRYWYTIQVIGRSMYLFGGFDGRKRLSDFFELSFVRATPEWKHLAECDSIPGARSTHSSITRGNWMYVFGGYDGKKRFNRVCGVNLGNNSSKQWTFFDTKGDPPCVRYTHATVGHGSKLIVFGGRSGHLRNDVHILELGAETPFWISPPAQNAPTPRSWHSLENVNGRIILFGGHDGKDADNQLYELVLGQLGTDQVLDPRFVDTKKRRKKVT